ncbi:MAG: class I SAM-dependent methyltransferase [Spirochaetia bacterium]|nr:class I SAM-dependent methyltransferase [Spirochaetia bacterium]
MKKPIYHRIFGYNTNLLPNSHLATLESGVKTIDEARKRTGATIGYPGWTLIYNLLLSHLDREREEVIIETGTNMGCTTIVLAQALIDAGCKGKVITVELDTQNIEIAKKNCKKAGVSSFVDFRFGNTTKIMPDIANEINFTRFAFLDASHLYSDVMFEFETIYPCLTDDALVLFDNTYPLAETGEDKRVNGALKAIKKKYGGNLINLEYVSWFTPGLAIWQKQPNLGD